MANISTRWIQLRKRLFEQIRGQVSLRLGEESSGLAKYRQTYERGFRKKWLASSKKEVLKALQGAPLVFMGDFHALQQSQKAHLRILKSLKNPAQWVVGLECVEARHQKVLDQYLAGKISEREFLKGCEWKKNWGFPWDHYRPIFRWLAKHKVRAVGLNMKTNKRSAQTLKDRDRFAAEVIEKVRSQYPEHSIFVIFGDLHLAENHLPLEIKKKSGKEILDRAIFLYQNNERVYFQMLEKGLDLELDVVRFNQNTFCLQNVPPWVKWQNYLLFLEESYDLELGDESDYTDHVAQYVRLISDDLGQEVGVNHFSIYSLKDQTFWDKLEDRLNPEEIKFCEMLVGAGRSFYWPEASVGLLARPSVNNASELAIGVYAATLSGYRKWPHRFPEQFHQLIWLEAVHYFGTKLVNPKRKTNTLADIKRELAFKATPQSQEALQLALSQKMMELVQLSGRHRQRQLQKPKRQSSYLDAGRILGGMLGEKLYFAHRSKLLSTRNLLTLIGKNPEAEKFHDVYLEILELAENLPEPFQSKADKL